MDLTRDEFVNMLGCSKSTFYAYIGRSEFNNIKKVKVHKTDKVRYTNVTEDNIKRLKELLNRKKGYYYV